MFLKLRRLGKLQIDHSSDTQCWDKGWKGYKYEAAITCHEGNLDADSFIIDNMVVKKVVTEAIESHIGSCELMVKSAAEALMLACKRHNVMAIDVHMILQPTDCDPDDHTIMEYSISGKF